MDKFPHEEWDNTGLYSGIPYVTGHSKFGTHDESILWMSAAETYVDIFSDSIEGGPEPGRLVNFISESAVMEFFMIASNNPKLNLKRLATVTGFQALPPLFSLGFHYSKWEKTSAK